MAELIVRVARKAGFDARALEAAATLGEVAGSWRPDITTLDLIMPRSDAYDVVAALKAIDYRGRLIIISGEREMLLAAAGAHASAAGLNVAARMRKPIDVNAFRELIASMIGTKAEPQHGL